MDLLSRFPHSGSPIHQGMEILLVFLHVKLSFHVCRLKHNMLCVLLTENIHKHY